MSRSNPGGEDHEDGLYWDGSQERNEQWWHRAIEVHSSDGCSEGADWSCVQLERQRGQLLQRELSGCRAKSETLEQKLHQQILQAQLSHQKVMRKQFLVRLII